MNDRRSRPGRRLDRHAALARSFLLVMLGLVVGHPALAGTLERLSVTPAGGDLAGKSITPSLSADGRYVAFISEAPGATAGDGDTRWDVFVRDRELGTTVLVSKSTGGMKGDRDSGDPNGYAVGGPSISATGRFVAFTSLATNLVPGPLMVGREGVYVHDRDADDDGVFDEPGAIATVLVSVAPDGTHAFNAQWGDISDTGRFVAFSSNGPVLPEDTNGEGDVYVRDRDTDQDGVFDEPDAVATTRVSVGPGGIQGNGESGRNEIRISGDGRVVAFLSYADNLVLYDTNGTRDVFVHDRLTGVTERVNVSSTGRESTPLYENYEFGMSGNGRFVGWVSQDPGLADGETGYGGVANQSADVLVHDRVTHRTTTWAAGAPAGRIKRNGSYRPVFSHDGSMIAFYTRFGGDVDYSGFEPGANRIELYVHDRLSGATVIRPILATDTLATTVMARGIAISRDARVVAFDSEGSLVPSDGNATRDVFAESCAIARQDDPAFASCAPIPFAKLSAGDRALFESGAEEFRAVDTVEEGIGPVFNATSCAECHNRPWIGGTSDRKVTRIGTTGPGGFDPLLGVGGPVIQTNGLTIPGCSVPGETIPAEATVVAERDAPALFGAGLIELIPDEMILQLADPTDRNGDGISGRPNTVGGRVGRFGRKAQIATLREFASDAYLQEMGITSPDRPDEIAPQGGGVVCDTVADPEDDGTNVQRFVDFMRMLAPLPAKQYVSTDVKRAARAGRRVFRRMRCHGCHSEKIRVPRPLLAPFGVRRVVLFSDLLLHDLGPGLADGIEQGEASGAEFRTTPLWGVGWSAPYLHDGRATTLADAILAHGGEAAAARDAFAALSVADRIALLAFLRSL